MGSVTKADEYSKADENGEFCLLMCRALGGHVKYVEALEPDAESLVRACTEGPYDCILGDRKKRGTYREFVFYDTENLYVEYIIRYKREGEVLYTRPPATPHQKAAYFI